MTLGAQTTLQPGAHVVGVDGLGWAITLAAAQERTVVLPIAHEACVDAALPTIPATDFGGSVTLANAPCPTSIQSTNATTNPFAGGLTLFSSPGCSAAAALGSLTATTACAGEPTAASVESVSQNGVCSQWGGSYSPQQICLWYTNNQLTGFPPEQGGAPLGAADQAYVPGVLAVNANGTLQDFTLAEGDEQVLTINLPVLGSVPSTFTTAINFLDARVNPDAAKATITSSCAGDRTYTLPSNTTSALALTAFVNTACVYTLTVAGRPTVLSQTAPNSVDLHRVDVDNVTVTRDTDGSTYTVVGTYQLDFGGADVAGPYTTDTGIDVLSGTYDLIIDYTDANGAQTQSQTITL